MSQLQRKQHHLCSSVWNRNQRQQQLCLFSATVAAWPTFQVLTAWEILEYKKRGSFGCRVFLLCLSYEITCEEKLLTACHAEPRQRSEASCVSHLSSSDKSSSGQSSPTPLLLGAPGLR